MTIKELGEKWVELGRGELRVSFEGVCWMARGAGRRMAGADLESAIGALLLVLGDTKAVTP